MSESPKYTRLSLDAQAALLHRIVESCGSRKGESQKCVVFDLDGTLLDNRPRTVAILQELSAHWETREPSDAAPRGAMAKKLAAATLHDLAYLVVHSLEKLGVTHSELAAEAEAYWKERFFKDEYLRHDVALPGAVAFAKACYEKGANLVYFTGRDLPNMGLGSFQSLRDQGFPIGVPGTELVLKPDFDMPDEVYKRTHGPNLARLGKVVGIFDNEPANCNVLLQQNPGAESVFVDTQHLPGAPALDPKVHVIGDFSMGR